MKKTTLKEYLTIFFRYSKANAANLVLLTVAASALEGLSFALFLPLTQLVTGSKEIAGTDGTAQFLMGLSLSLPVTLALLVVVFLVKNLVLYVQKYYSASLSLKFENRVKKDVMGAVFSAQWRHSLKLDSGSLMNAVNTQSRFAAETFKILSLLATEALNIAAYCAVGLWASAPSFFLSAAAGAISYFTLKGFIGRSRLIGQQAVKVRGEISGHWMTDLGGLKFIKGNRLEDHRKKASFSLMDRLYGIELEGEAYSAVMDTLPDFLMSVVIAVLLYAAFYVIHVPAERLIVTVLVLYRMNRRLMTFQNLRQRLFLYLPSFEMCRKIEEDCRASQEEAGGMPFEGLRQGIVFKSVGFSYDLRSEVLASLSLEVPKNNFVAIVGKSGSGKTTVLDLLMGLLPPDRGEVLVDGHSLSKYELSSWRKRISYVPQDPVMVEGTILDNIRMENESASLDSVRHAARMAHADVFIQERPGGYDGLVGDRGVQLSGGQKQRIALARALLRKPEILVLDEATSSLDRESERMIQTALEELAGTLTIVVVAHRMSTIQHANRIYVLEKGSVTQSGRMEELKMDEGHFKQLYGLH